MISQNILTMRRLAGLSQENVAEKLGVSRQTIAKWENGESTPDVALAAKLAELFNVSLDALVSYEPMAGIESLPPKGKHVFGTVTVGERGQIVIPARARRVFGLKPGSTLLLLGDEERGLALMPLDEFAKVIDEAMKGREQIE